MRGPKAKNKPKFGRPPAKVDWPLFEKLVQYPLLNEDIAALLETSIDTINRFCKKTYKCTFAEYKEQKLGNFKLTILQEQLKTAKKGNAAMQIWLGKNYLNQKDHQDVSLNGSKIKIEIDESASKL